MPYFDLDSRLHQLAPCVKTGALQCNELHHTPDDTGWNGQNTNESQFGQHGGWSAGAWSDRHEFINQI